jgi:hypothetical protein
VGEQTLHEHIDENNMDKIAYLKAMNEKTSTCFIHVSDQDILNNKSF